MGTLAQGAEGGQHINYVHGVLMQDERYCSDLLQLGLGNLAAEDMVWQQPADVAQPADVEKEPVPIRREISSQF